MNGTRSKRRAIIRERDGDLCCYCGWHMDFDDPTAWPQGATLEHVVRQADGGGHSLQNLKLACVECNYYRRTHSFDDWKNIQQDRKNLFTFLSDYGIFQS